MDETYWTVRKETPHDGWEEEIKMSESDKHSENEIN